MKRDALIKIWRHVAIGGIACILAIHNRGHFLKGRADELCAHNAVVQPVGDVLAGDTQGRAVFHQADVVDVGHFGAANALIDPAHHIAQNALRVVVQFACDLPIRQIAIQQGRGQNRIQTGACAGCEFSLSCGDIDLVIVHRV